MPWYCLTLTTAVWHGRNAQNPCNLKVHCRSFFKIYILIVLCETSSMIPISVSFASRWGSYEGAKLQKKYQLCVSVSGFPVRNVCTFWMEESRPGNELNKKSLSLVSLYLTMKEKLLETMKEIPLLILK